MTQNTLYDESVSNNVDSTYETYKSNIKRVENDVIGRGWWYDGAIHFLVRLEQSFPKEVDTFTRLAQYTGTQSY